MTALDIDRLLAVSGALRRGHFALSSGRHSASYVQCALLLEEPRRARRVGSALAATLAGLEPTCVVAPALGGLVIGHEVAAALDVPFRFTERSSGRMMLRRGFRLTPDDRVIVVEDVVTTGRSTAETIAVVETFGACVGGVGAIVDRSGGKRAFDLVLHSLMTTELDLWPPESCPLCRRDVPLDRPGSRESAAPGQPSASR